MISAYQTAYRTPLFASAMLVLVLLQGSSFNLTLAFRGPLANETLATLVTLIWVAMYGFAAIGLFASFGMNWISWIVRYRLLLTFVMTGVAFSISWSLDAALSIERTVHLIGTTIVALYIGFCVPLSRMLRISAVVFGFIMLTSVLAALFVPDLGLEDYQGTQVWAGTLAAKNTLGFWAAVSLLLSCSLIFWTIPRSHRLLYLAIAALSLICLYNSVSATSLLAVITAGLVMLYLYAAFSLRLSMTAMVILGLLVAGLLWFANYYIDVAELSGRSGDLTGRGEVWAQTWQLILKRPLTGYGYGTLWFPTTESIGIQQSLTDFTWTVYHAHNGLLQIASEIGLPLTALVVLMITQQLVEITYCQYRQQQPGVLFVLGFTVALLVSNYSEARLLINRDLFWIFFVALPISMLQQVPTMATRSNYKTSAGPQVVNGPHKLREARQRKEQKKMTKERIKRLSGLKVVNPLGTSSGNTSTSANNQPINDSSAVHDQQKIATSTMQTAGNRPINRSIIENKKSRSASKSKALRLKKNRRQTKAG